MVCGPLVAAVCFLPVARAFFAVTDVVLRHTGCLLFFLGVGGDCSMQSSSGCVVEGTSVPITLIPVPSHNDDEDESGIVDNVEPALVVLFT